MHSPIILQANYATISPGETRGNWVVYSRMMLWSLGGNGRVRINGQEYPLLPNRFFFTPWAHRISYISTGSTPLSLAGIHLIPDMPPGQPVTYKVYHVPDSNWQDTSVRRDTTLPSLEGLIHGYWQPETPLYCLADYIVKWYIAAPPNEAAARRLAAQLIEELAATVQTGSFSNVKTPHRLGNMLAFIYDNLHRPVTAAELAHVGECTPSTVQRLFQRHLQETPSRWIQRQRIKKAAELLSTTQLPVAEVGQAVGIDDPYYFSRLFRKINKIAPTEHRKQSSVMGLF